MAFIYYPYWFYLHHVKTLSVKSYYIHKYADFELFQVPLLKDNYSYVLVKNSSAIVIDPGEAGPILELSQFLDWKIKHIVNTHHHWDHTDGNPGVREATNCEVWGPQGDSKKIQSLTQIIPPKKFKLLDIDFEVIEAGGHTLGHILLHLPQANILFSGDVLFCGGCGRLFEGTAAEMYGAIQKIKGLKDSTSIFCGHEYSLKNLEFARSLGISDSTIETKWAEKINSGQPTVPSLLSEEKQVNPFVRAKSLEEFTKLRLLKDKF